MSEYWKSTPKYWCKHCKTFVKDTKLEKTNHDATPKHQGNIKRFLRDLHRGHEREERDKQRAKDEVQRLNGVVSGSPSSEAIAGAGAPWRRKPAIPPSTSALKQATPAERKQQLSQLAEMGVAVPEEFRKELAMAGEWETVSETLIYKTGAKREEGDDHKPETLNIGVRKRKYEGQDEEEEAGEMVVRKGWGSTTRQYPSLSGAGEDDLDSLLGKTKVKTQTDAPEDGPPAPRKPSTQLEKPEEPEPEKTAKPAPERLSIKNEDSELSPPVGSTCSPEDGAPIKSENPLEPEIMFKKRKSKPIRHK